jgi:peptidoglycan/xylan/chitin deacetylase (PgdA/CDA1 family)
MSSTSRDLTTLTRSGMRGEVQGAYQDLVTRGLTPKTFVYPYGAVNSKVERLVRSTGFSGARGSYFGLDGACTDKFNLHDIFVGKTTPAENIERWIDQAIDNQRWLVLELHDVLSEGGDEYSIHAEKIAYHRHLYQTHWHPGRDTPRRNSADESREEQSGMPALMTSLFKTSACRIVS